MKIVFFTVLFVLGLNSVFAQQVQNRTQIQTQTQLAIAYYNAKDYEKAIPLLLEVYNSAKNRYYYQLYLNSMIQLERYKEAEENIKSELANQKVLNPDYLVFLGYVLEKQDKNEEAEKKYAEAIEKTPLNKGSFIITANGFMQFGKYEYAEKTYLKARNSIPPETFSNELARVYLYLRNYDKMMEEYLNLLRTNEKQISRVQSSLASALRLDIDNELRTKFRELILKRIQAEPGTTSYNRLLIWFFLQEKKFSSALRQAIALDKRTNVEDNQIFQLGSMALNSQEYSDAQKAFEYILAKGERNRYFAPSFVKNIQASNLKFIKEYPQNTESGELLSEKFSKGLEFIGYGNQTIQTIIDYAHLLGFYLNEFEKSIQALNKGLEIPQLKPEQIGAFKTEMADIYVYSNDPWEATLIYSQVIDANKNNSLGDEVKLKKAKLGYYLGNFSWAKAQLDVLKASTSKLTANDAMELSLLISNNLNLDTTEIPLKMFAQADLSFFQNKDSLALSILSNIEEMYPYNGLVDDILFRKSKIEISKQNYTLAAEYLTQITEQFAYETLSDDALFALAELYNFNLNEKEKAKELYKQMLTDYPGSVFADESRKQYRELRKIFPDKNIDQQTNEDVFMEEPIVPNEFN